MMTSAATINDSRDSAAAQDRRPWLETPLDTTRPCIRILKLHRGSGGTPLICDLNIASLDDNPSYEVLSYVWGDAKVTQSIIVGGVGFLATRNLFDFLCSLRSPTEDRFLWADAICIDQTNDMEKVHQMGLMTRVYQYATEAHIWFGPFTKDWEQNIGDKNFILMSEMTSAMRKYYERRCFDQLKYFKNQNGFKPLSQAEFEEFRQCCSEDIFHHTLTMLDRMADSDGKKHLYTYPVFISEGEQDSVQRFRVNHFWVHVLDCIRWMLARPWWTRVWTLQEAVLPRVDPTVHAPPHSFKLSRLLNGIYTMVWHNNNECCKWFGGVILTRHRDLEKGDPFTQPLAICKQREDLRDPRNEGIALNRVVRSIQGRKAKEINDHWFGILGFLSPSWQEADKRCKETWTTAQLFIKCSKLLLFDCKDLTILDLARRLGESKISDLPSWTIDLSAQRTGDETDYERWRLYDAAKGTAFEGAQKWPELKTPDLVVKAIRVGTVFASGEQIPLDLLIRRGSEALILKHVKDWRRLYNRKIHSTNEDAFWRAVFMDRDLERDRMHVRTDPLYGIRLAAIKEWFQSWDQTGDNRDLDVDRKAGGLTRGNYHFWALNMNVEKTKFFMLADDTPGMGPHDVQAEDEVYVLAGCKSPAVLRKGEWNGMDCFKFVGLCFVDAWMYGRATQDSLGWETLRIL
jgi:hypothetical protein